VDEEKLAEACQSGVCLLVMVSQSRVSFLVQRGDQDSKPKRVLVCFFSQSLCLTTIISAVGECVWQEGWALHQEPKDEDPQD
jgi:hypothetical protein